MDSNKLDVLEFSLLKIVIKNVSWQCKFIIEYEKLWTIYVFLIVWNIFFFWYQPDIMFFGFNWISCIYIPFSIKLWRNLLITLAIFDVQFYECDTSGYK